MSLVEARDELALVARQYAFGSAGLDALETAAVVYVNARRDHYRAIEVAMSGVTIVADPFPAETP